MRRRNLSDVEAQELLRSFLKGNRESFDRLVESYSPMVFKVFLQWFHLPQEDAEDLFQETFLQLFLKAGEISNVRPWLLGTAINQAKKRIRRLIRDRNLARRYEEDLGRQYGGMLPEDREVVRKALAGLSRGDRTLLQLMYYTGLNYREASETIGRPIGSIGPMRSRALRRLGRNIRALEKGLHAA